jgi:hypothetical protein
VDEKPSPYRRSLFFTLCCTLFSLITMAQDTSFRPNIDLENGKRGHQKADR